MIVLQIAFIILFGFFVEYADEVDSGKAPKANATSNEGNSIGHYYPSKCWISFNQDVAYCWRKSSLIVVYKP